ncbi:SLC13 family permease [Sneathiella chungangensis]|uniref:SLC13 family permease n=1 Tax=Sneathiella chungangensis TaxID=1418234 RepID=A0A845MII1_9PROT|nr:SLC13 family permease [Sneathiella chungangensis]MZR23412.1 SLC13 family permease [Sneathiella chungangensis]
MTTDQILLFSLFGIVFALLIWGRWRYDLIAFVALVIALVLGLVPTEQAFAGFGHPATIIIALVLVVSRGLVNSGAVDLITRRLTSLDLKLSSHIAAMSGLGAIFSAFMNNVAALAMLMPVDLQASAKAKRAPRVTLMPLAFATILGGLITLIGTPPNIIIAAYRESALGEPFGMFDFAPVGLACAIIGIVFITVIGWRLIPGSRDSKAPTVDLLDQEGYLAELLVPKESPAIGMLVRELDQVADDSDAAVVGLVRNGKRLAGQARNVEIRAGDILVVDAVAKGIDQFRGAMKLEFDGEKRHEKAVAGGMVLMEFVVPRYARIEGRSAMSLRLLMRHGVTLLGVSRQGQKFRDRVRKLDIQAGDILLLLGPVDRVPEVAQWLGVLPLAERGLSVTQYKRAGLAAGIFAVAIAVASFGWLYLAVALAIVVAAYVVLDIVPIQEVYQHIEWPVIVLLGSMIPLGTALEESGGTGLIAGSIVDLTAGLPVIVVLTVLMVVIMTLSDVLNNTATAVIGAPIAVDIANRLGANPDPFLMVVAVAASCAFLTPIGHKNNTLIMGPGGYKFGDYWRMGLPLEILVIAVAIPSILFFWPL